MAETSQTHSNKRQRDALSLVNSSSAKILRFSPQFSSQNLKLLKLPKILVSSVKSAAANGATSGWKMVGEEGTDAVLCTENETYSVVRVETSNDVFLVPPATPAEAADGERDTFEVTARCNYYYELKRIKPSISVLKDSLRGTECFGDSQEGTPPTKLITYDKLTETIQMSTQELDALLRKLNVVTVDGYLRILDFKTLSTAIDVILSTVVAKEMDIAQVSQDVCIEECPSVNPIVVAEALRSLSSANGTDGSVFALDAEKVARACAHLVFTTEANDSKRWEPEEFMTMWNARLPNGVSSDVSLLKGIVLREVAGGRELWTYFPRSKLSKQEEVRFQELFQRRQRWELADLEPYLRDLAESEADQAKLLLAYTRSIADIESSDSRRYIVAK